jgi:choline dehydrogenase-like flavoprotein
MSEQAPNPDSRVTLSEETDALGQRRVKLDWRLEASDIRTIKRAQEIIDDELRSAGLGRLHIEMQDESLPSQITGGWHHMGTTRMHNDPTRGVVDAHSRVHGIANLFIAGPSVFPTCGYANPVLTIVALTARLGDHVKKCMASFGG